MSFKFTCYIVNIFIFRTFNLRLYPDNSFLHKNVKFYKDAEPYSRTEVKSYLYSGYDPGMLILVTSFITKYSNGKVQSFDGCLIHFYSEHL